MLPSAVLSTHTGGFSGYTFRDLTEDMPAIAEHWLKEGISFEAVYTGYPGSARQIDYVADIFERTVSGNGLRIVDPAMADNGKLPNSCHWTGDIYASSFVGALMRGKSSYDAARIAADYTVECIKATAEELCNCVDYTILP